MFLNDDEHGQPKEFFRTRTGHPDNHFALVRQYVCGFAVRFLLASHARARTTRQWVVLALLAGLMLNMYYADAMLLMIVVVEALREYARAFRTSPAARAAVTPLLTRHFLFAAITLLSLVPTFVTRYIVYRNLFESGYVSLQDWGSIRRIFWPFCFLQSMIYLPGRRCFCLPRWHWSCLDGASRA